MLQLHLKDQQFNCLLRCLYWRFSGIIFKLIIQNSLDTCCEIALRRWRSQNHTNEKSTVAQVMAWCLMAPSQYLNKCWLIIEVVLCHCLKTQWVNSVPPYVRKLQFMYEAIRTSGKCRWNIYCTSSKCRWSIYRTSRKRRGTLRIVHKVERSSPTV